MSSWLIAIDGGGSTCRAALAGRDGEIVSRGLAGPANVATDPQQAAANIIAAARCALAEAGLPAEAIASCPALLGLAGARQLGRDGRSLLSLPFSQVELVGDGEIALEGALGPHDGIMAILGTGSAFLARQGGEIRSVGGWGVHLADQGGGARLGREALKSALLSRDGVRPRGVLAETLLAAFGDDPARMVAFAGSARQADFARHAPAVFDAAKAGDGEAEALLAAFTLEVEEMLAALLWPGCERIVLMGGLAPLYAPRLAPPFAAHLAAPLGDALDGAVRMAQRAFFAP
ncbi:BadF/BadG/BcrA/BcrD ATPase family protein [Stappia indica]|uniref:N-acetylglucosamine kinase n=1 Tax=Stappia indica TaxID=538381 RepID=A0A857C8Z1_9HYPH|nr:BadF/BadG/BcrA/BcrD ATPase family protein [Stappia indica]QGZ35474.1 N-acetylglucosamine kinase [Stappia indica]